MDTRGIAVQVGGGLGNQLFGLAAGLWASHEIGCRLEVDVSAARPHNLARAEVGHFAEREVELDSFTLPAAGDGSAPRLVERPFRPPFRGEMRVRRAVSRLGIRSKEYWPTPWQVDERILDVGQGRLLRGNFHTWGYWSRYRLGGGTLDLRPTRPSQWFGEALSMLEDESPIGLHLRLGDYTKVLPHLVSTRGFLSDAIRTVEESIGKRDIWLFSDDPPTASEMVASVAAGRSIRVLEPPPESRAVESLCLLSQASAVICSASSFSIWAAQLADTEAVVVPDSAGHTFGLYGFNPKWTILGADGN